MHSPSERSPELPVRVFYLKRGQHYYFSQRNDPQPFLSSQTHAFPTARENGSLSGHRWAVGFLVRIRSRAAWNPGRGGPGLNTSLTFFALSFFPRMTETTIFVSPGYGYVYMGPCQRKCHGLRKENTAFCILYFCITWTES